MQVTQKTELDTLTDSLGNIASAYDVREFKNIIESPEVPKNKKVDLLLSLMNDNNKKLSNLIKLLNEKDRLMLIPSIYRELEFQIALDKNIFEGKIMSDYEIEKDKIRQLEESFSKKFDANVKLNPKKSNYPGIKIALDSLGIEASFSLDRLKSQITEHILKAI